MRLIQFLNEHNDRRVAKIEGDEKKVEVLAGARSVYDLALEADRSGKNLIDLVRSRLDGELADYDQIIADRRLLPPLDHPDPAHCFLTGTGLTHLGSAKARDAMHTQAAAADNLTDSMRLFQWGLKDGKPSGGRISIQPEWFYKGNGYSLVAPERELVCPSFALDGGEEAELVGLYIVSGSGDVLRVGFTLGNEFSDHVMEAQNYLYLAHSKLRPCSMGPELLTGDVPGNIVGSVRIYRKDVLLWEAPFLTGEENMSYNIASLEHHHFKYDFFRQPGDVHCHFFGTATLSRNAGIITQPGDRFEISAPGFGRPLRNSMEKAPGESGSFRIRAL
jgi:hypothetical protein